MSRQIPTISKEEAQGPFYVGIDLGGTNIKVGLVDDLGRTLARLSVPTDTERGPEDGARRMGEAARQIIDDAGLLAADVARVGLATPGTMNIPAGMLVNPHNLKGWDHFPIRDRVSHHARLPVSYVNDAAAAAYGEYWVGCGREFHSLVLLTLGTGVGGGVIIGDLILEGENSHGAECGHIIVDFGENARVCPCGQPGHLEAYAGAKALVKRTREALDSGAESSLIARLDAGEELDTLMLSQEAESGDRLSKELILETAMYLGVGVVSLMHTIDPSGVLLGGAMTFGGHDSPVGREFLQRVREEVRRRAFPVLYEKTTIDFASLGGDAGYIGAAGIARRDGPVASSQ